MASPNAGAAIAAFERLLDTGKDGALLRFGLGSEYLKADDAATAVTHLSRCTELDPGYSAAWKLLGKALAAMRRDDDALAAWREGIAAAQRKGDKQAMREMQVFVQRLAKQRSQE